MPNIGKKSAVVRMPIACWVSPTPSSNVKLRVSIAARRSNERLSRRHAANVRGETSSCCVVAGDAAYILTSRSGSRNGSGRSTTAYPALKIAVVAPMPIARVETATSAKPGVRASPRSACRTSAAKARANVTVFVASNIVSKLDPSAAGGSPYSAAELARPSASDLVGSVHHSLLSLSANTRALYREQSSRTFPPSTHHVYPRDVGHLVPLERRPERAGQAGPQSPSHHRRAYHARAGRAAAGMRRSETRPHARAGDARPGGM